jgi:Concanavalin A-like lectin/glucanases superfamily
LNVQVVSGKDRPSTGRTHCTWRSTVVAGLIGLMLLIAVEQEAQASELLAQWPLDEGSGQVAADASGRGHQARLGRLPVADSNDPAWVPGRLGTALRFAGSQNQFAQIAGATTLTPRAITVEAWVRRLGTPGAWAYVLSNGGQACDFSSFGLYGGAGGGLAFYVSGSGGYVVSPAVAPEAVWDGAWHYAVGTYDGEHVRVYLDGVEVGHGTATGLTIDYSLGSSGGFIGTYRGTCEQPFTGDVDEIVVRDRALSPAEIAALGEDSKRRPLPPQLPPVSGPPAPAPRASPAPAGCFKVRVSPGRVLARRSTRLRIEVRRRGRAAHGVHVTVGGLGVRASARTRRTGRAHVVIRSRRSGRLRVKVRGQPSGCAPAVLTVRPRAG